MFDDIRGCVDVLRVMQRHNADFTVLKKQTDESILHRVLIRDEAIVAEDSANNAPVDKLRQCIDFKNLWRLIISDGRVTAQEDAAFLHLPDACSTEGLNCLRLFTECVRVVQV